MKLVYSNSNKILVENVKNLLEQDGIEAVFNNEYASGAVGELSAIDTWPELWVTDENFQKAQEIVVALQTQSDETWTCTHCGESNGVAFELCWQCQAVR